MTPQAYDAWYDSARGRWIGGLEFALLRRHLDAHPGSSLLDVGCGTGWFTRCFAAAGLNAVGLDINAEMVEFARQQSREDIAFAQADACSLPFADQSFDQVISVTALCFVADWPRAIAEIVRVTRRRFVLGLLNRNSLLWLDKGRRSGQGACRGAHWHTRRELDDVLKDLPVHHVRFDTAVFFPSGSDAAQLMECTLPNRLRWGSFLVVSGDVSR